MTFVVGAAAALDLTAPADALAGPAPPAPAPTESVHIPDGFLTGEAAAIGAAVGIAGVAVCLRGARRTARERDLPVGGPGGGVLRRR